MTKKQIKKLIQEAYDKGLASWCTDPVDWSKKKNQNYKGNRYWVSVENLERFVKFILAAGESDNG